MSTSDPRENGFTGDVEDTGKSIDGQYPEQIDIDLSGAWSHTGMCPACGVELEIRRSQPLDIEAWLDLYEFTQLCPSCGWESDIHYEN